jgi:phosphoribosyl-ATP pyrophosphohydrolase
MNSPIHSVPTNTAIAAATAIARLSVASKATLSLPALSSAEIVLNKQRSTSNDVKSYHKFVSSMISRSEMNNETLELMENISNKIMQKCGQEIMEIVQNEVQTLQMKQNIVQHWRHLFFHSQFKNQNGARQLVPSSPISFFAKTIDSTIDAMHQFINTLVSSVKNIAKSIIRTFVSTWKQMQSTESIYLAVLKQSVFLLCSFACVTYLRDTYDSNVAMNFESSIQQLIKNWNKNSEGEEDL